jgi:uncharacterized protein YbcI
MEGVSNPTGGEVLATISEGLVALHTRYYGKGPDAVKSYHVDDTVVCVLRGGYTTVERTLIESGRRDTVREMREGFQAAMTEQFTAVVERATGRHVEAYLSQVHMDPDIAVEIFLLGGPTKDA